MFCFHRLRPVIAALAWMLLTASAAMTAPPNEAVFPTDEPWSASWIWGPEKTHGPLGCFRKTVVVSPGLKSARAQMSGDDGYTLYVNGHEAYRGGFWWKTTNRADLLSLLRPGVNVLAARVNNAAHPGGFLLQLDLVYHDGRHVVIGTDGTWRFSAKEPPAGWLADGFDDRAWERAVSMGRPPKTAPWGEMPLEYMGPRLPVEMVLLQVPARTRAGSSLEVRLTLRVPPGEARRSLERQGFPPVVVALRRAGRALTTRTFAVRVPRAAWRSGQAFRLSALRVPVSPYAPGGRFRLEAGLRHSRYTNSHIRGFHVADVEITPRRRAGTMTDARVRTYNGAPTLFLDGKPTFPMWFFQWRVEREDAVAFGRAGVNVFTFDLPLGWTGPGKHDFAEVDEIIGRLLDANPAAYIVPRVSVGAPGWWIDAHPDEAVRMADGTGWVDNGWGGTKHESFASERGRRDAGEALRRLVRHIRESPYGDRVIGYHIANGIYGEWHAWSATNYPDTSEPMRRAFAEHARRRYGGDLSALRKAWGDLSATFEGVRCPTLEERRAGHVGVFRDPARSRCVADYYEAFHRATTDSIEALCRAVKEETQGKLFTLVFYGYWPDLAWPQEGDHRALERLARSPYVDCFSSPHSYERRKLGQDGLFRNHPASLALHGKLFIDEGDDRTHVARDPAFTHVRDLAGSVAVIRREFANALTHNVGLWYMDQQGDWFHDATMMAEIARAKRWGDRSLSRPRKRPAQVAVVVAPQSDFHMAGRTSGLDHVTYPLFVDQIGELCRAGAPFDVYTVEDLAEPGMPDYDCYVMLECFYLTGAQRESIRRRVMRPGKTVLWFYAPGYVTDDSLSVETMSSLTGIRMAANEQGEPLRLSLPPSPSLPGLVAALSFGPAESQSPAFRCDDPEAIPLARYAGSGAVGMAVKDVGGCRSVYCAAPGLPAPALRALLRAAGVHVYLDSGDPFTANERFLAIHAATGGRKTFRLPHPSPVYDVTEERVVSPRTERFTVEVSAHQTRIFHLGPPPAKQQETRRER